MKAISKKTLEDIKFRCDIVEIIGSYINLKKAGSTWKALCPFHKEKTPSFTVNQVRQMFYCFGCSAGGDIFRFVMMQEGVDFISAVRQLADRAGIKLELDDIDGKSGERELMWKVLQDAASEYEAVLKNSEQAGPARKYIKGRRLEDEALAHFRIGYSPDEWDYIIKWGLSKGYSVEQLESAGLVVRNREQGKEEKCYDRFRGRLMFPIKDEQGRVVGFSGRALAKDVKGAKYVNSPESPVFHKGRILYALDIARKKIVDSREAIICEGQIDVIRCHQAGFDTAVASQGTAFSEDHVRLVRRYADSVVLAFDSDSAGKEAAIRTASVFLEAGISVRIAQIPAGQDPDSFISKMGASAFKALLDKAVSIVAFYTSVMGEKENLRSEIGAMRAVRAILSVISRSPNAVQRERMVQETAALLGFRASSLLDELRKLLRRPQQTRASYESGSEPGRTKKAYPSEESALCVYAVRVLDNPEYADMVQRYLPLQMISNDACRAVLEAAVKARKEGGSVEDKIPMSGDGTDEIQECLAFSLMEPPKAGGKEFSGLDAVKDLIMFIWRRELEKERKLLDSKYGANISGEQAQRRRQLTYDLKAFRSWSSAEPLIEIQLEDKGF